VQYALTIYNRWAALGSAIILMAVHLLVFSESFANSWRVEQDGTGNFQVIQDAVDAAAAGDTILIGPGNYNQGHPIQIPSWPQPTDAFVYATTENLTFIGVDSSQVFIGPDEYYQTYFGPLGFCGSELTDTWRIEGVTITNVRDAVYGRGRIEIRNCQFVENANSGIITFAAGGTLIERCGFLNNLQGGIFSLSPSSGVVIRNCEFILSAISLQNTSGFFMENCHMVGAYQVGGVAGVQFDSSSGTIINCQFEGMSNYGINAVSNSNVVVSNCDIQVLGDSIRASEGAVVEVSGSVLAGAYRNVWLRSGAIVTAHGNHILKPGLNFIKCEQYSGEIIALDFTNNYWGTTDLDSIALGIWDYNDNPTIKATIDFEPISDIPLPTEKKSLGDVKSMFR